MLVGLLFLISIYLIGSYMNIPIREIASREPLISGRVIDYYWLRYVIPPVEVERRTLIAVNVGGAVIPVLGLGIAVPALLPPIMAALLALLISPGEAPIIAYISGTLGSLIGADLLNLNKIPDLRAPVASIGGAGTFDGIFLTGIISVLLA